VNPKVAVVIVIVIVVVFIAALSSGGFHGSDTTQPDWVKTLKSFIHPKPLDKKDVSTPDSGCMSGANLFVQIGRTCTYKIAASGETVRRLKLGGGSAKVVLTNGDKALPVQNVNPGDNVDVYGAGGKLQVTCAGPISACVLVPSS